MMKQVNFAGFAFFYFSVPQKEAAEYGIDDFPSLVVFENGIPNLYDGSFESGEEVLGWIVNESSGDHTIEIVTDNMLDQIVAEHDHVAVVFYKKVRNK